MTGNCGAKYQKCKTFDDAINVSLKNDDSRNQIILDGGYTKRNFYNVISRNITYNKSLVIKGDPNSKFYPVIQISNGLIRGEYFLIMSADNIDINIQDVQLQGAGFVMIDSAQNISVLVSNCNVQLTETNYLIYVKPEVRGINVYFHNSTFFSEKHQVNLLHAKSANDFGNFFRFASCLFENLHIVVTEGYLRIENCVLSNTSVSVLHSKFIYIFHSIFKNLYQANSDHHQYSIVLKHSNATIESCSFFNNTKYGMSISDSTVSVIKSAFYNNTCPTFMTVLFSYVTFFKVLLNSIKAYHVIKATGSKFQFTSSSIINTESVYIIYAFRKFKGNSSLKDCISSNSSLSLQNTTISKNRATFVVFWIERGSVQIISSLIQKNTLVKSFSGGLLHARCQVIVSHGIVLYNSITGFFTSLHDIYVYHTHFISNNVKFGIISYRAAYIESTIFDKNVVNGSLIRVPNLKFTSGYIINSRLKNITVSGNTIKGDVIRTQFRTSNIQVENFKAIDNSFRSCFVITGGSNIINDSFLSGNMANGRGRLIYFEPLSTTNTNQKIGLRLTNIYSSFKSSDTDKEILYIVMKNGFLHLSNLTSNLVNAKSVDIPVINIRMKRCGVDVKMDVKIECSSNYYSNSTKTRLENDYIYQMSCKSCPRGLYSYLGGSEFLTGVSTMDSLSSIPPLTCIVDLLTQRKNINCHTCPAGGICESNIRSRGNFYGFVSNFNMLEFIPCPEHYCCSKEGAECTSFNTCNSYRTGTLCGGCMQGYHISFFSNNCIPISACTKTNRSLFWGYYFIVSSAATFVLCFGKDVFWVCKKLFAYLKEKIIKGKHKSENNENWPGPKNGNLDSNHKQTQTKFDKEISCSAVFNVLASFYQLQNLLQVPVNDKKNWTSAISDFFNLNIIIKTSEKYCPTKNKSVVYRDFVKDFLLPLSMMLTIALALNIRKLYMLVKTFIFRNTKLCKSNTKRQGLMFMQRFYVGYYVVAAFSYKKLSSFALRLIHCVNIGNSQVLYIAGDIKCFNIWQVADMFFLTLWVIPFPVAVSFAYYLQKKKKISVWIFTLCIVFPFMTVVVLVLNRCFHYSLKPTDKDSNEESIKTGLFEIFEGPYRSKLFWWETWTLYERLIVSFLTTFLIDPVVRLFALTLVLLLFLWFHVRLKPFKDCMNLLVHVDFASYICLNFNLVINMVRAVVYVYSLQLSQYPINVVLGVSMYLEYLFTPIWVLPIYFILSFTAKKNKKS